MGRHCIKNILMVVQNCSFSIDKRVSSEAFSLHNAGFSVSVISPRGVDKDRKWVEHRSGICIYRFPVPILGKGILSYILEYLFSFAFVLLYSVFVLCVNGFDVIHFANPPDIFFPIGFLYRLLGKKVIFDQHDLSPEMFTAKYGDDKSGAIIHKLLILSEKLSYRMANKVVVTNESFRDNAIERGGIAPRNVVVLRNGYEAQNPASLNIVPGLRMGKRILATYVGMISDKDGVDYFLKSVAHIVHKMKRRDIQFSVVGDGDGLDPLKHLAAILDIMDYLTFTGWLTGEELHAYLSTTDIGVSPEPYNSLNDASTLLKVLEYMSYGKPIVAFKLRETMYSAGPAALYAKPNSVEDFGEKIVYLSDNPDLRRELGLTGYQRIVDKFAWKYSEKKLIEIYRDMLNDL